MCLRDLVLARTFAKVADISKLLRVKHPLLRAHLGHHLAVIPNLTLTLTLR